MKPTKIATMYTVDMTTGEIVEQKSNAMTLLPPPPAVCQECACEHEYFQPHNQQSLYYQMRFQAHHGRRPTWTDAMAHCDQEVQRLWKKALREKLMFHGMEIPVDLIDRPGDTP